MGEYARSLAIARGCIERWPQAQLHFVLSRQAPYAASVPFPATLLDASPTFHSAAVIALMQEFRPSIVVFDNAGRTAQLRAARARGARVVFISARRRQRRKAFRFRWLGLIDEHWIAYPEFIAGGLSFIERLKLTLHAGTRIRFLDVILSRATAAATAPHFAADSFLLLVPGGGTGHPRARDAVDKFLRAARVLAAQGIATVFVGAGDAAQRQAAPGDARLHCVGPLPQAELAQLLRDARLVVANGGSTLLQGLASGAACIAVPIAKDQDQRIARCVDAAVVVAAALDADSIAAVTSRLWNDAAQRAALAQRARALRLADGVQVALEGLSRLAEPRPDVAVL